MLQQICSGRMQEWKTFLEDWNCFHNRYRIMRPKPQEHGMLKLQNLWPYFLEQSTDGCCKFTMFLFFLYASERLIKQDAFVKHNGPKMGSSCLGSKDLGHKVVSTANYLNWLDPRDLRNKYEYCTLSTWHCRPDWFADRCTDKQTDIKKEQT